MSFHTRPTIACFASHLASFAGFCSHCAVLYYARFAVLAMLCCAAF